MGTIKSQAEGTGKTEGTFKAELNKNTKAYQKLDGLLHNLLDNLLEDVLDNVPKQDLTAKAQLTEKLKTEAKFPK